MSLLRFPNSTASASLTLLQLSQQDSPDLGGPGQPFGAGDAVTGGVLGRGGHHFIPFQGEGLSLQAVVIIVFLFFLAGVVGFVGITLVEGIEVILLNEGLEWGEREGNIPKTSPDPGSALFNVPVPTLCSLRPRFCCCSMRSEAEAGGEAARMFRITWMLSSGSGGSPSISLFSAFMLCSSSNPPSVHCRDSTAC